MNWWYKWHTTGIEGTEGTEEGHTGADPTATAGGKMVAPLIAGAYAAFALGSVVSGGYHVGKALETRRYWQDYYRNTRRSPRYPYRVGYYDYYNTIAMSMYSAGFGMRNVQKLR